MFTIKSLPETQVISRDIDDGTIIEDIKLGNIKLYVVKPEGKGPFPAVHFIHWLETHAEDSNRRQFLPMAKELARQNYLSILPDCFWSVEKEEYAEKPSLFHKKWWAATQKGVVDTEYDRRRIITQVEELLLVQEFLLQQEIQKDNVILAAHDFGAMFGILMASTKNIYSRYVFMALTSRFSDWFRFGSKQEGDELRDWIEQLSDLDPITHLPKLKIPGLFLMADDDFYVPQDRAKTLVMAAATPKELRWYEAQHSMNEKAFSDLKMWITEGK